MMMMHGNQPALIGHGMAIELTIDATTGRRRARNNIPVIQVLCSVLPGAVDSPLIIFRECLERAYSLALTTASRQPHPTTDTVYVTIGHSGLQKNGGHWGSLAYTVNTALESIVEAWDQAMQSGTQVDLSEGALEVVCTFTLGFEGPLPLEPAMMGAEVDYHVVKKRMFVRSIHDEFYTQINALKKTPNTEEKLCFPMSFMGCGVRTYVFTDNVCTSVEENKGCRKITRNNIQDYFEVPIITTLGIEEGVKLRNDIARNLPQFSFRDSLVVCNPYKQPSVMNGNRVSTYVLEESTSLFHKQNWVSAAKCLHKYVESKKGVELDVHQLSTIQAYADVFDVVIHVLRVECQLFETEVFVPESRRLNKHIYVLFGDSEGNYEHCHAVTNRRNMVAHFTSGNYVSSHNYCDFCGNHKTNNNQSIEDSLIHINECAKNYRIPNIDKDEILKKKVKAVMPKPNFYSIQRKQDCKYCSICKSITPIYEESTCIHHYVLSKSFYQCRICHDYEQFSIDLRTHQCRIPFSKEVTVDPEYSNLFVYDIEASQMEVMENKLIHEPNCICLRHVYNEEIRRHYTNVDDFCFDIITDPLFLGSTIIAHNGGGYDHQFFLQYIERHNVMHVTTPRPGAKHKYLEIVITKKTKETSIHLKDFMMFFPSALKDIAESFKLPIQKGDFPHRFNSGLRDEYIGALPPIGTVEDFYCLQTKKNQKEVDELRQWHETESEKYCTCFDIECSCTKQKWDFQEHLRSYCWLDTDILAQSVKLFREAHIQFGAEHVEDNLGGWKPTPIDPFQFSTQSQVALSFFLEGHRNQQVRPAISKPRTRSGWSKASLLWLYREQLKIDPEDGVIEHIGNSNKEYFESRVCYKPVDGFRKDKYGNEHIYEFYGCFWHACPHCHILEINDETAIHPRRQIPWKIIHDTTQKQIIKLTEEYNICFHYIYECQFNQQPLPTDYEKELSNIILDREMFRGGRTEVFSPYARSTDTTVVQHHDVTSMYPYICANKMLPFGFPKIFYGSTCKHERLQRGDYFGYVRCLVIPPSNCVLGLLPSIVNNKLQFDLRPKLGVWFTEELYLAMEKGYVVDEIYEVFHFDENNRSTDYFRGYMSFFLRLKQEAEGWVKAGASSENPSDEEKEKVRQELYIQNGHMAKMVVANVRKNPVKRALAKLNLNCLWGKLAQDSYKDSKKMVFNYDDWMQDIILNPMIDQASLKYRMMVGSSYMCYYSLQNEFAKENARVNIWMASAVTAWARTILHERMFEVGPENVLYCDTDSVVFVKKRDDMTEYTARGLGNWTDETEEGDEIEQFLALAPKCYMKIERNNPTGSMKAKGVRMTVTNKEKTSQEVVASILEQELMYPEEDKEEPLRLDCMVIAPNCLDSNYPYASMFTRYGKKILRAVLNKRKPIPFPTGGKRRKLLDGDVDRLYLQPCSDEHNPKYDGVYSRYES